MSMEIKLGAICSFMAALIGLLMAHCVTTQRTDLFIYLMVCVAGLTVIQMLITCDFDTDAVLSLKTTAIKVLLVVNVGSFLIGFLLG